ncbi:MAG: hypothetical protein K8E66_12095, partial [Phycisphaerales bacterium]|nr:hypothetical protein [Phycisphaerales bacterium]
LRLIETRGVGGAARVRWNVPVAHVQRCDALERPDDAPCSHDGDTTILDVRPHEIVTLMVGRSG